MSHVTVLFEATIKEGKMDDYLKAAASLKEELAQDSGLIASERFESLSTKGKLLSKSEWRNEESIAKWRNHAKHRICQQKGRDNYFLDYKITVVTPLRCYTMDQREGAPTDSDQFFGL